MSQCDIFWISTKCLFFGPTRSEYSPSELDRRETEPSALVVAAPNPAALRLADSVARARVPRTPPRVSWMLPRGVAAGMRRARRRRVLSRLAAGRLGCRRGKAMPPQEGAPRGGTSVPPAGCAAGSISGGGVRGRAASRHGCQPLSPSICMTRYSPAASDHIRLPRSGLAVDLWQLLGLSTRRWPLTWKSWWIIACFVSTR